MRKVVEASWKTLVTFKGLVLTSDAHLQPFLSENKTCYLEDTLWFGNIKTRFMAIFTNFYFILELHKLELRKGT